MDSLQNRRRFLQVTGTTGALSLAGCSQFESAYGPDENDTNGNEDGSQTDDTDDSGGDSRGALTAFVEPDEEAQAALMARQQELVEAIEADEISREDAAQELQGMETEMRAETADAFESYAGNAKDLTIEESVPEMGLFLVDGTSEALVGALTDGEVGGLLPGEEYEAIQQPQPQPSA